MATRPDPASLAEHLERSGRHPVILIGGPASGKTMLLMSLLAALGRSADANFCLGDPILPPGDPRSAEDHEAATHYYHGLTHCIATGEVALSTQLDRPVFIPVDIETRSDGRVVKLALLEGRGEWYSPVRSLSGSVFPAFRAELTEVVERYRGGLSVVWVAPFCEERENRHEYDFALVGALAEYRRRRGPRVDDSHLFLLSKWDLFSRPLEKEPSRVTPFQVADILAECFPNAWPRYRALSLGRGRRAFMHYSAGCIAGNVVRHPPDRFRETFERFPQVVLNWLYGNATETQAEADGDGRRTRRLLFSDVLPRTAQPAALLERLSVVSRDVGFYPGLALGVAGTLLVFLLIILLGLPA